MALIAMAVFDTAQNKRADLTRRTLESLLQTVDFTRHRICIIVNEATEESAEHITAFQKKLHFPDSLDTVIWLPENIGTARAINKAWATRKPGEMCIKMDNDVVIHRAGWVDELEEALQRDPQIGIIGLKRKDLAESPLSANPIYRSTLRMLPHQNGQRWLIVEDVQHVMGTCQAYNPELLDKIGYLYQPGIYGFDDSLAAVRCRIAGFKNCFLHGIEIDHIDPGDNVYTEAKREIAGHYMEEYHRIKAAYESGKMSVWHDVDGSQPAGPDMFNPSARPLNLSTR